MIGRVPASRRPVPDAAASAPVPALDRIAHRAAARRRRGIAVHVVRAVALIGAVAWSATIGQLARVPSIR